MISKKYFTKSIATILSTLTFLTAVSPCTFAEKNFNRNTTRSMNTTSKILLAGAGAIALGLTAFMAYEHYKPVYVKDLSKEDQERWRTLHRIILSNASLNDKTAAVRELFNNDSSYKNPKLLNAHFSPDGDGKTLLIEAAFLGFADICEILIKHGANVNVGWKYGTPLHYAAKCHLANLNNTMCYSCELNHALREEISNDDYVAICACLLRHGANINAKCGAGGETPLYDAIRGNSLQVVNLLIKKGANVNAKNNDCETPLDVASTYEIKNSTYEIKKLLLDRGAKYGNEL